MPEHMASSYPLMIVSCAMGGYMKFLLFLLILPLSGAAPGDDSTAVEYTVWTTVTPSNPAPDGTVSVLVTATTPEGGPIGGDSVAVTIRATLEATTVGPVTLKSSDGSSFTTDEVVFPAAGTWTVTTQLATDASTQTSDTSVLVECGTERPDDSQCCDSGNCASGLCIDMVCVAQPTCDDGIKNAAESDVDCGGADCAPCAIGKQCGKPEDCDSNKCKNGTCKEAKGRLIGTGDRTPESVTLKLITNKQLYDPADLAFSVSNPNELWVVNRAKNSFTVITNPGLPNQSVVGFYDKSIHFLEKVNAISFGDQGTFATCGDSRNDYNGLMAPNDFMGPALWPDDRQDFVTYGPDAAMVHLDMLHNTSYCMGIAAETANRFYALNGQVGSVEWYDFKEPHPDVVHGHGGEDHKDGLKKRYLKLGFTRKPGVPSNMIFRPEGNWLYIADTGNSRIIRFQPANALLTNNQPTYPVEQNMDIYVVDKVEEVVPASAQTIFEPSGLIMVGDYMYVSDYANGFITAFDADGNRVNMLDTGLSSGALGGMAHGQDDRIYLVNRSQNQILRLDP